jgi:hypothetical protein
MRGLARRSWVVVSLVSLVACSSGDDTNVQSDASPEADVANGDAAPAGIDLAASQGVWSVGEDVGFVGKGAGDLGAISITHGVGTIQFDGETASAFFFTSTSTPSGTGDAGQFANERDFEIVAASPDRFVLAWITCANGGDLAYVFYESTDGFDSAGELPATGTCTDVVTATSESITLPEVAIPPPDVVPEFTIDGAQISFDGKHAGTAELASAPWTIYPFNVIDCSSCASPGWFELHTLFWKPDTREACLGILYLEAASPSDVLLAYSIDLPSFTTPYAGNQLSYAATWTTP